MKVNSLLYGFSGNVLNDLSSLTNNVASDTRTNFKLGSILPYLDDFWGGGELIYGQCSSGTISRWGLCLLGAQVAQIPGADGTNPSRATPSFVAVPTSAQYRAQPLAIASRNFVAGDVGWWFLSGTAVPARSELAVTASSAPYTSSTLAQNITTSASAGRGILGMHVLTTGADTFNVDVVGEGRAGTNKLLLRNPEGLYPGCRIVGTGFPAASFIEAMEGDGRLLTWSALFTAQIAGNYTAVRNTSGTNCFPLVMINRPCQMGQIV